MRVALLLVGLLFGCESVVEEVGGSGGDAAQGGAGAGGEAEGAGGTIAPTGSACEIVCSEVPQCAAIPDCLEGCENARPAACGPQYDALVACNTPHLGPECSPPDGVCPAENEAFEACIAENGPTQCTSVTHSGGGSSCEGSGPCLNGQMGRIACVESGAVIACECYVDEALVGECNEPDLACTLETSCCEQFF